MLRRSFRLFKGDLSGVVLHDCNPQHGAPYNNHDRVMRDEEFEAFLASVKGWKVLESGAIHRAFDFQTYQLAYEWMGRVFAFGYIADKYPKLQWRGTHVEVTLYSGHFHGITRREARLAAFMNDHFNLLRKALVAQKEAIEATRGKNPMMMMATMDATMNERERAFKKRMVNDDGHGASDRQPMGKGEKPKRGSSSS